MSKRIVIGPVTRIEGHAKITIYLDEAGQVEDARFHVTEFRGFEKFCEGRPLWEMPGLTARICGICPVSHLLASAKAGDRILSVGNFCLFGVCRGVEYETRLACLAHVVIGTILTGSVAHIIK